VTAQQNDFHLPTRHSQRVPFEQFEPLLIRIRQAYNCSQKDALQLMGYNGSSVYAAWGESGAPVTAVNAAKGVLADLGEGNSVVIEQPALPMAVPVEAERQFGFDELSHLFAALHGIALPQEAHRALIRKLAREIARTDD
jgi:hypothetical protein